MDFNIFLDGRLVGSWVSHPGIHKWSTIGDMRTSESTVRPFQFAKVEFTGEC